MPHILKCFIIVILFSIEAVANQCTLYCHFATITRTHTQQHGAYILSSKKPAVIVNDTNDPQYKKKFVNECLTNIRQTLGPTVEQWFKGKDYAILLTPPIHAYQKFCTFEDEKIHGPTDTKNVAFASGTGTAVICNTDRVTLIKPHYTDTLFKVKDNYKEVNELNIDEYCRNQGRAIPVEPLYQGSYNGLNR